MFGFLEKQSEKKIFFSYLRQFGLTSHDVNPRATRLILDSIYHQANEVARRFQEPVESVSRNIIGAAAWGSIYCLLGPTRMIELDPEYRDIADEVEMELMMSCLEERDEHNIYRQVISILTDYGLCHSEVMALIQAGTQAKSETLPRDGDRSAEKK